MPRLSVLFVRAALLYLLLGLTLGMLLLWNKGILISPMIWLLLPAHIEFLQIGAGFGVGDVAARKRGQVARVGGGGGVTANARARAKGGAPGGGFFGLAD